jgi:hypothetical protein
MIYCLKGNILLQGGLTTYMVYRTCFNVLESLSRLIIHKLFGNILPGILIKNSNLYVHHLRFVYKFNGKVMNHERDKHFPMFMGKHDSFFIYFLRCYQFSLTLLHVPCSLLGLESWLQHPSSSRNREIFSPLPDCGATF